MYIFYITLQYLTLRRVVLQYSTIALYCALSRLTLVNNVKSFYFCQLAERRLQRDQVI